MRITAASIENYKRVRSVTITPDADRTVVLIGGKNRQGKSSILDALSAAIGGAKSIAGDPVRHGADVAEITVELAGDNGGKLVVRRAIAPDKTTTLEVRDEFGPLKAPQAALDKLIGARFIDPLAFLQLPPKEQRAQLMRQIDGADRIAGLNERRERAFTKRTEVGRDHDKAVAELTRLELVKETPGEPIDVAALSAEQRRFAEQQRAGDNLVHAHQAAARELKLASERAEALHSQLRDLEVELKKARKAQEDAQVKCIAADGKMERSADEWSASTARREQLEVELARAGERNRAIAAAEAQLQRRADVKSEVDKLAAEREGLTNVISQFDQRKAEILGAAKLPVDGLAVTDDGIELDGVPFLQASAAERMRVALAIAVASSPGLDDIWVRDGALLDDEMLAAAVEHAAAAKKRLWIERVGDRDPGVIVIQDGRVKDAAASKGAA